MELNIDQIEAILPHRYPFLLVDRITECTPGERAKGLKCVTANEPFFQGHFPGFKVMPGVLIIEALAQVGAVEAIFTALALKEGFVPPTIGYQVPDPACDLDIVPNAGRNANLRIALSNSLGFGGHNAALVLKRWEE